MHCGFRVAAMVPYSLCMACGAQPDRRPSARSIASAASRRANHVAGGVQRQVDVAAVPQTFAAS